jgi:ferredoxin-NADP reductase
MGIRFEPHKKFTYDPGQFLSLIIPVMGGKGRPHRRAYSFSSPIGESSYELCVKYVPEGPGSEYWNSLQVGDTFKATSPYGDFVYEPKPGRSVCMISTGTGVGPFRAMTMANVFQDACENILSVFGARTEDEIIYPGFFQKNGITEINALTRPPENWQGFTGRVTDFLRALPPDWQWHSTDFYLCGNGSMVDEVRKILRDGKGVAEKAIHQEVYFKSWNPSQEDESSEQGEAADIASAQSLLERLRAAG